MSEKEELLELYKIHVELSDRVSQRRSVLNQFYITFLTGFLGVVAFMVDKSIIHADSFIYVFTGIIGIIVCIIWFFNIHSYKQLNSAKFDVIFKIEEQLSFQFFRIEWEILKKQKKYNTLSNIEKFTPVVLLILFIFIILYGVIK